MAKLTIEQCADAAGSFNDPAGNGLPEKDQKPYTPPELCIGTMTITQGECADAENLYQESLVAAVLSISGAPLNIFKLLGIHEQGKLIDLTGNGNAIGKNKPQNAFDVLGDSWVSIETGSSVAGNAYIGYDFGIRKTSYGQPENAPGISDAQHITSLRIQQSPRPDQRALQVRIERANNDFIIKRENILFTGIGNGVIDKFYPGVETTEGSFMAIAESSTTFTIAFVNSQSTQILGIAIVDRQFNSKQGSFTISNGTLPFAPGDMFSLPISLDWKRVDVVNLPNIPTQVLVRLSQSSASRYWRIVPTLFAGVTQNEPWVIEKLELFDHQATRLDDIQDPLLMENRDRDYAKTSMQIRVQYTPFDAVSDLSKFGFQVADIFTFSTSYAEMVRTLGRPIVIGDVLEVPSELQYDHNLRPVHKFLEVSDVGWSSEGFTTGWKPIIYKFQAQQLIPSMEHRDILGTVDTQKYTIDDNTFFTGIEQIQTSPLTATEANYADAKKQVPEKGTNIRETASGTNRFRAPGSYDGTDLYQEDGLPPNGMPYDEGFKLPDVAGIKDGTYFRLIYDPKLNIPARLYKFSKIKNKFIYVETDRRAARSSHKPSELAIFGLNNTQSLTGKIV